MGLKKQLNFIGIVLIISILGCQSSTNPISNMDTNSTNVGPVKIAPTTSNSEEGNLLSKLPPNFLADSNTICTIHRDEMALSCLDSKGWHVYTEVDFKYPLMTPNQMAQCPGGRKYLQMSAAFYLLEGETLIDLVGANGANFLACGSGNEIWVGYSSGVSLFDGSNWTDYPTSEIFGSRDTGFYITSMVVSQNGSVWVSAYDTIASFDGTNWRVFGAGKGFASPAPFINKVAVDENGILWAVGNAIMKYDGTQWSTFPIPESLGELRFITIDKENAVWVGAFQGIIYTLKQQTDDSRLQFTEQASLDRYIYDMQFDGQGHLWVVTNYGLYAFDGSAWIAYRMDTADLYENKADAIAILGDGPRLVAPATKTPGSVHGKLVNPDPAAYVNMQVEICVEDLHFFTFTGKTPCSFQKYHALSIVNPDGSFLFEGIPVGKYYLLIQDSSLSWFSMGEFEVKPGALFEFGEIVFPKE